MPVTYELDQDAGFIHTSCFGEVTFDEVIHHFEELGSDPLLPERLDVLLDLSETETLPSSAQLRSVAALIGRLKAQLEWGTCAVVASRDALYGMSRVFQAFVDELFSDVRVFRVRDDAKEWLASQRSRAV